MAGRVCIVTGANSGIGKATAKGLVQMGATVVLACRDAQRGEAARAEIVQGTRDPKADVMSLDLASFASIHAFARDFRSRYPRLDVLINNAGVYTRERTLTVDGFETQFQVNYLGHFLLTKLLLELLESSRPSRIVNVTSQAHHGGKINFEDLQSATKYSGYKVYNNSKLAQVLFTYELARRLAGTGATVNCVHPGVIRTNLGKGSYPRFFELIRLFLKRPEKGAQTSIYVASSPALDDVTGKYFAKKMEAESSPASHDPALAKRLWDVSAGLTGLSS